MAIARLPASLGCRWSPPSHSRRNRNGSAGSRVAKDRPGGGIDILAADLSTGAAIEATVVARSAGGMDVRLNRPPGVPVLVGLRDAHPGLSCRVVAQ